MKNKLITASAVICFVFFTGFLKGDSDIYLQISKSIDIFGRVYKEVTLNYVDDISPMEFMLAGIKGMLSTLDPYTVYIDENMKKDIDLMTTGKYGGIGASVGIRNDKVTVIDLIEGYSAERQGIRIGDVIKKVNDVEISKDNYNELSSYLKGEPGKIVHVTIERDGIVDNIIFDLVLEEIIIRNLTYYGFVPEHSNNVYLKLSSFSRAAGEEIKNALIELRSEKEIRSIVFDLRSNPGGLLDQAIDVSEKFLMKDQLIVSVIGRDSSKISKYYSQEEPIAGKSKLIVLVNENSASASEIVAGAIQDHDRGVIIGNQSFGKGLVQTVLPLSYNTSLKITTARYYTPSGRCIQKVDYSKDSRILSNNYLEKISEYVTDNNRKVFSAGGITPDTIMSNLPESEHLDALLARGMFFRFATNFFNTHPDLDMDDYSDEEYFSSFLDYLKNQEFEYTTKTEKLLKELKSISKEEEIGKNFESDVDELLKKMQTLKNKALTSLKGDVVTEIKKEIAARLGGRDARIIESLKNDKQFDLALKILNEEESYSQILALGK